MLVQMPLLGELLAGTGRSRQTSVPEALLISIEALEKERESVALQLEVDEEQQGAKVMKALVFKDIKSMLAGVIKDVKNEKSQNSV